MIVPAFEQKWTLFREDTFLVEQTKPGKYHLFVPNIAANGNGRVMFYGNEPRDSRQLTRFPVKRRWKSCGNEARFTYLMPIETI